MPHWAQVRAAAGAAAGAVLRQCGLAPSGDAQEEAIHRLSLRLLVSRFRHVDAVLLYLLHCIYRSADAVVHVNGISFRNIGHACKQECLKHDEVMVKI